MGRQCNSNDKLTKSLRRRRWRSRNDLFSRTVQCSWFFPTSSVCRGALVPSTFIFTAERMLSRTAIDIPVPEISGLFLSATCFKTIGRPFPRDKLSLHEKYPARCLFSVDSQNPHSINTPLHRSSRKIAKRPF